LYVDPDFVDLVDKEPYIHNRCYVCLTHLGYGINFLILSVSLVSVLLFLTHRFSHTSRRLFQSIHHSHHPSLPRSFTPGLKRTCFTNPSRSSARFSGKCRFDFIRVKNKLCQVNFLLDNNKKTVKMAVDLTEYKTVFYIFCSTKLLSCSFSDRFTEQLIGYHTNVVSFC